MCTKFYTILGFLQDVMQFFVVLLVIKPRLVLAAPQRMLMENGLLSHRARRTTSRFLPLCKYAEGLLFWRRRGEKSSCLK